MSYVPVVISEEPSNTISEAFGVSEERYDEMTAELSKRLALAALKPHLTKSGICKLFVDLAQSNEEAVLLAFMAGGFLYSPSVEKGD